MRACIFLLAIAGLFLGACSRPDQSPAQAATSSAAPVSVAPAGPRATTLPTPEQLAALAAEGPEPTLRQVAAVDYWLHYKLMQATGIEKELGGEAQAIAALKSLGDAYEEEIRGVYQQAPRLLKATFTGEGMSSGFLGMGMGTFAGMVGGGTVSGMVSSMSDQQIAELESRGGIHGASERGFFKFEVGKDGSHTQSMEFEVNSDGVKGKVRLSSRMEACPDADGRVSVEIKVDSQMSVAAKPGVGGHVQSEYKYERWVDDEAHLIDTPDGSASKMRIKMGGQEGGESQTAESEFGYDRGGTRTGGEVDFRGFSIFRPEEVDRTIKLLQATELLQQIMAEMMLRGIGSQGGAPWESGRCIDLQVKSTPAKRQGARPNTAFDVEASPRARGDGMPARGTVTATLSGGSMLRPGGKVKADARYDYAGPAKKNESASIAFESRSKRGVGRATLEFDTKIGGYLMEGGAKGIHFSGQVCDLENPFHLRSGDVTLTFTPSSKAAGRYDYKGTMSAVESGERFTFRVHGNGEYTVKMVEDMPVSIDARGPGTVETPYGPQTADGKEHYTLTRLKEDQTCTALVP